MSLYSRLISRAATQEDEAAPLRLTPKDRGLGSGIAAGPVPPRLHAPAPMPTVISRQESDTPEEAQPARTAWQSAQTPPSLHRVEEEDAPAVPARMPEEEDGAPAAKRMADTEEPEAAPRRMEAQEEDPAPKRMEAEEEAQPQREEAPEEPEAAPLRRLDSSSALPPEQPADELRHDNEGQALAARRQAQAAPPPVHSPTAPAPNISEAAPFTPAFTPPPTAPQAPSSAAPAPRPKVHIDQIDVIIGAQGGQASPAPTPSGARALLARRYVRGA